MDRRVGGGNQPTDGKGKGRPSARLMWLVGWENLPIMPLRPAGACGNFLNEFNAPSAIAAPNTRISGHDGAGRRSAYPTRAHPAWQSRRQASPDLRWRGDAGREEGRPCRRELPLEPGPEPVPFRPRPACRGVNPAALECPPRGDQGAGRAPPGHTFPFGAPAQAHHLSETRRCDQRRRAGADVRCRER